MTREEILDMAIAIFRHQGIKATRLEHIAGSLNLSVSSLYEQVGAKADLLLSAVSFEINREHEYIERIRERETSLLGGIKKLYLHTIRFFFSFHPSFFKDLKSYPQVAKEFGFYIAYLRGIFNEAFQTCVEQGLCRKECDSFLFSTFLCLRLENIKNGIILQKEKVSGIPNFVITNLLLGCCTDEGRAKLMNA